MGPRPDFDYHRAARVRRAHARELLPTMPTLSSILVQRGAVTMRAVEDAIARQVFHGGDLATNLLEVGAIREDALLPVLAESLELPPAPLGRLPAPPARVLRLVPGELALRHGIFPVELWERALVVATAEPLSASVEDDLGFALDLAIRQVVAPLVRIRQAIGEHYGIPLERRFLRLVAKLDGQVDPSPSAAPPPGRDLLPVKMPRPISIPSPSFGTGVPSGDFEPARLLDERPQVKTPFVAAHDFVNPAIPKSPGVPRDAAAVLNPPPASSQTLLLDAAFMRAESFHDDRHHADAPSVDAAWDAAPEPIAPQVSSPEEAPILNGTADVAHADAAPIVDLSLPEEPPRDAEPASPEAPPAAPRSLGGTRTRALAGVLKQALRAERASAPLDKTKRDTRPAWRPANRRKGPFTAVMAEREMEEATVSDAVLEILFAFAQQFFEYTAIFVVQGDLAEGRDASGPGADRVTVAAIGVPLDRPSSLARARDRRAPLIGRLDAEGLDADLARDLSRSPRAVALLPVLVKTRVVAIVYGDDGAADVELPSVGDVIAMIALAGAALERVALRKKLAGRLLEIPHRVRIIEAPEPAQAAETRAQSVAALARAVSTATMPAVASLEPITTEPQSAPDPELDNPAPIVLDHAVAFAVPVPRQAPVPVAPAAPPASVATFSSPEVEITTEVFDEASFDEAAFDDAAFDEAAFDVAPPDDSVLPPSQGPRTARYFDDPPLPDAPTVAMPRVEMPGAGILFPEEPSPERAPTPPPESVVPRTRTEAGRRGLAPIYEGRSAARSSTPAGFEPLPSTPPPNATAWTTFPSAPPPEAVIAPRARADRPIIPREDHDEPSAPEPATSVKPRAARASVDHTTVPSVVVDVGAEYQSLLTRFIDGGRGSQEAFAELVREGEHVVSAVMARFPGPLRVDRHRARAELPAASQCGPILELVVAIRRPALPFVSVRLSSPDPEVRFWATHVLGELRYAEAASALLPRLFDDDAAVRRIARRSAAALVGAGAAGAPILKGLEDITKNPEEPAPNRVLAIETMGEIRSGALVPSLVTALEGSAEDLVEAARRALLIIARQDFGRDADRWRQWWARHGKRHRIEWLIDALMHEQPSLRRAAGDELKALTKEYFGYYDDLPKRERERAQELYRTWWEREGRARFAS
ncbi:Hypothetical protein A7982_00169 [Minicystis rosea]|nr:Hypothetical protein A7982_00169 [Minicystis rosea]